MSNKALRIVIKPDLDTNTQLEDDFSTEIFRRVCKACDTESPKFVLFRPQSREKEEFDSNIAPLLTKDHDDIILLTVFNNTGKSDSYLEEIIFTFKLHAMLVLSEGVLEIARNEDTFQQLSNILIDTYGFTRLEDGEKTLIHASLPVQPPVSVVKARAANSMATKRENETLYRWLIEREFTENSINKLIKEEFTNPGELAELNKSDIESLKLTLAQRKLLEKTVLTLQRPKSTPDQQREDKTLVTTRGLANNAESNTIPNATIYTTDILQTNTEDKDTGKQLRADEEAYTKRKQIKWSDDKRDEGCWQIIKLLEKYLPYLGFLPLLKNLHRAVDEDGTTDKATKETNLEDPMERTEKEMSKKRLEDGKKTYEEAYTKSKQISEGTNETPNEELVTQKKQESDELRSLLNNDPPVKVTVMNDVDSKYTNSIVSALADTDDRYRHEGLQVLKIFAFKWNKHIIEDHNALEELGWFRQHHRTHRRINVWVLQRDTILDAEKMKDNTHCHIVDWSEESQSRKDELQKKYFVPSSQIHFVNIVGNSQEDAKLSHLKVLKQIITSQSQ